MTIDDFECPVRYWSSRTPESPFITDSIHHFSYREINRYVDLLCIRIREFLCSKHYDYLVVSAESPVFYVVSLFSSLRIGLPLYVTPSHSLAISHPVGGFQSPLDLSIFQTIMTVSEETDHILSSIRLRPKQLSTIVATSGTTSDPKLVVHSLENHWSNACALIDLLNLEASDRWFINLPITHVSGIAPIFRMSLCGGSVYFSSNTKSFSQELLSSNSTCLSCVQTTLSRFAADSSACRQWKQNAKVLLVGGGPLSHSVDSYSDVLLELPIWISYGMTETASAIALAPLNQYLSSSKLKLLRHCKASSNDQHHISLSGESMCIGYARYDTAFIDYICDANGFFQTEDLGSVSNNLIEIYGRRDDMFISGGYNISPSKIISILTQHPEINSASLTAVPDDTFQYVGVLHFSGSLSEAECRAVCLEQLAHYEVPKIIYRIN